MRERDRIIEHRPKPPIDKVIGVIGAVVIMASIAWWWRGIGDQHGLIALAAVVVPFIAACLLLAAWMDRRRAARKAGQKSSRS